MLAHRFIRSVGFFTVLSIVASACCDVRLVGTTVTLPLMVPPVVQAVVVEAVHQAVHRRPMVDHRHPMAARRHLMAEAVHRVATE